MAIKSPSELDVDTDNAVAEASPPLVSSLPIVVAGRRMRLQMNRDMTCQGHARKLILTAAVSVYAAQTSCSNSFCTYQCVPACGMLQFAQ